jgi:hypothetical protein
MVSGRGRPAAAALAALALFALAASALAWPRRDVGGSPRRSLSVSAGGALRVGSSLGEGAILTVPALAPGASASGRVAIGNRGAAGSLILSARNLEDRPGPGGGSLSRVLRLSVRDVTAGSDAIAYSGTVASLRRLRLGVLAPRASRHYLLVATLPEPGGLADELAGSELRFDLRWKLTVSPPARCSVLLSGDAGANRILGTAGSDRLRGFGGDDRLSGGPGADCISGGAGRDRLYGGAGDDLLEARDGVAETVDCGTGDADQAIVDARDLTRSCEQVP